MTINIRTNIFALQAMRNLQHSTSLRIKSFERLSSGQRINRASDDAAGLAISSSLGSNSRILGQATRNINDGISLINITDGALSQVSSIVTRIRELAEQAANGTYSLAQRRPLDAEAQQLRNEHARISATVNFNGIKPLDGSQSSVQLQVGTASGAENQIVVSLGSGVSHSTATGTFQAPVTIGSIAGTSDAAVGDFNGDGNNDVVFGSPTASSGVRLGNGDGTFKSTVTISLTAERDIQTADFNGDGKLDIFGVTNTLTSPVGVSLGNGDGTFKAQIISNAGDDAWNATAADFNGDGKVDIATVDSGDGKFSILIGNGDGTFKARVSYVLPIPNGNYISIGSGDFNGDSIADIYASGFVFLGNGNGTFKSVITTSVAIATIADRSVNVLDINRDGFQDIVSTGSAGGSSVIVTLGNGNGTFKAYSGYGSGTLPASVDLEDIDADGLLDAIATDGNTGDLWVMKGLGDGSFSVPSTSFNLGYGIASGIAADFTGDGVSDVYVLNRDSYNKDFLLRGDAIVSEATSVLTSFSLLTQSEARATIDAMAIAQAQVNLQQGLLGAYQSRLTAAAQNVFTSRLEYDTAFSRIVDVDVAEESANLVRQDILQKAGIAILSQANQAPGIALLLLNGI